MNLYTKDVGLITKIKIEKIFKEALRETNNENNIIGVSLSFVDENQIQNLNKKHRSVDRVTDVLSFPMLNIKEGQKISKFKEDFFEEIYLGDIVICTQRAKQQAKQYGHSFKREICFLALHGFLHLMGYDHIKDDEEKRMMDLAEKILQKCNIRRD